MICQSITGWVTPVAPHASLLWFPLMFIPLFPTEHAFLLSFASSSPVAPGSLRSVGGSVTWLLLLHSELLGVSVGNWRAFSITAALSSFAFQLLAFPVFWTPHSHLLSHLVSLLYLHLSSPVSIALPPPLT